MPTGLKRYQQTNRFHFLTFSCYRRQSFLATPEAKSTLEQLLEDTRAHHSLSIFAYVLMPEHIHLFTDEPPPAPSPPSSRSSRNALRPLGKLRQQ